MKIACIDVPDLPLQLLLRERGDWRSEPVAVVLDERPDARITHINGLARGQRLRPGMRYGTALQLVPGLRAAPVSKERVGELCGDLAQGLGALSPRVEPDDARAGVFYVDPRGLERLFGGAESWARAAHAYLRGRGFVGSVVVGYGRFATFALARLRSSGSGGALAFSSADACAAEAARVPLAVLGISDELREGLATLGVRTVGDLTGLSAASLHTRFGNEARLLFEEAAEVRQLPFQARVFEEAVEISFEVDPPDHDRSRILFGVKGALHELLRLVIGRGEAIAALELTLELEGLRTSSSTVRVEAAAATRDSMALLELLRLKLETLELREPVHACVLTAACVRARTEQLCLFAVGPADLSAGNRALARLRAAFGPHAVSRASLRAAHLPEARFAWEPLGALVEPRPAEACAVVEPMPLIRRLFAAPLPLAPIETGAPVACPALAQPLGRLRCRFGPYRVTGGWWVRAVERDYYYAETDRGDLLWLFYDRRRARWFLHALLD